MAAYHECFVATKRIISVLSMIFGDYEIVIYVPPCLFSLLKRSPVALNSWVYSFTPLSFPFAFQAILQYYFSSFTFIFSIFTAYQVLFRSGLAPDFCG